MSRRLRCLGSTGRSMFRVSVGGVGTDTSRLPNHKSGINRIEDVVSRNLVKNGLSVPVDTSDCRVVPERRI